MKLPGSDHLLRKRLLAALAEAGPSGLDASEAMPEPRPDPGQEEGGGGPPDPDPGEIRKALGELEAAGLAVEGRGRWREVRVTDLESGVVAARRTGRANREAAELIIRSEGPSGRVYEIASGRGGGALPGDRVLFRPSKERTSGPRRRPRRREADRRGAARRRSAPVSAPRGMATVVKIVERRHQTLVGLLDRDGEGRLRLGPYDSKVPFELEVRGGLELISGAPEGRWVVAALDPPGGDSATGARSAILARVIEDLGATGTPGVGTLAALRDYEIRDRFPPEVSAAAARLPADPEAESREGRDDLTGLRTITIDGESARDFDDALSFERLPEGGFRLWVHIADVAQYVVEGGELDREAYLRGTSVYFPSRAVPMLPEGLSNGLCSLRPERPRLTVSAILEFNAQGRRTAGGLTESVIESDRRMTYGEVQEILDAGAASTDPLAPWLGELEELMWLLNAQRRDRGSVDFDLPAGDVVLDTDGYVVGVRPQHRTAAHRIVEECMIAANEAVASFLEKRHSPALYRNHPAPGRERLEELNKLIEPFGLEVEEPLDEVEPGALQRILEEVAGRPEESFVTSVVLRSLDRAVYGVETVGHYALASPLYCHFTSPIRRYPDLVVHRRIKAEIHGRAKAEAEATLLGERLPRMAEDLSRRERRAERAERDVLQWKKVRFLADRTGEVFRGRITGVQPFGFFVQLDELFVDGLVPVRSLGRDFYRFEGEGQRLVGESSGRVFRLGDEVEVELVSIDQRRRGLDFRLIGIPGAPPRGRPPSGSRPERGRKGRAAAGTGEPREPHRRRRSRRRKR